MNEEYNNGDRFDQYIREEVDKVSYSFNPEAWSALNGMLDSSIVPPATEGTQLFTWLTKYWWAVVIAGLVLTGLTVLLLSSAENIIGVDDTSDTQDVTTISPVNEAPVSPLKMPVEPDNIQLPHSKTSSIDQGGLQVERTTIRITKLPTLKSEILEWHQSSPDLSPWQPLTGDALLDSLKKLQEEKRRRYLIW
ncbi:MAG: hypothetical protein R3275_13155 [Saprospiraceae bacterium]|nr:hypothetical protein [Saprospiraceae bacterium]